MNDLHIKLGYILTGNVSVSIIVHIMCILLFDVT